MKTTLLVPATLSLAVHLLGALAAQAHVPYLEREDYSAERPFVVQDPEQSIAVYAWLQKTNDVDIYRLDVTGTSTRIVLELLVPVNLAYLKFLPTYALIGPGLPPPTEPLPFAVPSGQGVLVFDHESEKRPLEFEPFGGKWYFIGPELDDTLPTAGTWRIAVWNREGRRGDYTLAIGFAERFAGPDLVRALVNTKIIRENGELHVPVLKPRK